MRPPSQQRAPRAWVLPCLVLLALLAGPLREADIASPAGRGKVVLKFSHNQPTITIPHQAAVLFKQLVEERTQGYYDVQIFPAQQLGGLRDQVEQTMLGTIEVTQQPAAILSLFVPKVMLLDFPFLWPQHEEVMWQILDGPLGHELLQALEAKPLKGVDVWSSGFKQVTTSTKPIRALADFTGLKMRVIPSLLLSAQYEAWGASPTPVDFKELYTALEQGLVDGQENPAGTILDLRLYEVQKYMTESRHGFLHYLLVFHKPWFDAQPPAHQALLMQAMHEAGQWQRRATRDRDADAMQRLKEAGVQVQTLTGEAREQLRQRSLQVHAQFAERVGKDYLQRVYAAIAQIAQ
jgi:tripartite ATP-independent transporter DctP family solute receptor